MNFFEKLLFPFTYQFNEQNKETSTYTKKIEAINLRSSKYETVPDWKDLLCLRLFISREEERLRVANA